MFKDIIKVTCPQCGYEREAQARNRGSVRQCLGCQISNKRATKKWASQGTLHGESKEPLYRVWNAMKQRCNTSTSQSYVDYGGRGISYCMAWEEYIPFRDWALSHGYKKKLLLDRIDNDGNYEPSNCRWVLSVISAENRRTTKMSIADVAVMKSLYEKGVSVKLIPALYRINATRFRHIRDKVAWKQLDPTFSLVVA